MLIPAVVGIAYYNDGIVLVRKKGAQKWDVPEQTLDETMDAIACIKNCIVTQTGHETLSLGLYKIQSFSRSPKQKATLRFIFGCRIASQPIAEPQAGYEARHFTPNQVVKLADKKEFNDPILMKLIHDYYFNLGRHDKTEVLPGAADWTL